MLFQQLHVRDDHAAVHGFADVVNGQQRDLHSREGFIQINNLAPSGAWLWPVFCRVSGTKFGQDFLSEASLLHPLCFIYATDHADTGPGLARL